jgi:hypothetical protein
MELFYDPIPQIHIRNDGSNLSLANLVLLHSLLLIFLILGILHGVMPEVKSLCGLNNLPEPLREVCIVNLGGLFLIFHADKHLKVVEIEASRGPDQVSKIFCRYETVVVLVEIKKSLSH